MFFQLFVRRRGTAAVCVAADYIRYIGAEASNRPILYPGVSAVCCQKVLRSGM